MNIISAIFALFGHRMQQRALYVIERVLRHKKVVMKTTAQGRVVRFTPFRNFNFEQIFQTIAGDKSHQSLRDSYFVQL